MLQNNPIDSVEDVLNGNNWSYQRTSADELRLEVTGGACEYDVVFVWLDNLSALQIVCEYDLQIHANNLVKAYEMLNTMNARLVFGHFEFSPASLKPCFRHSGLMNADDVSGIEDFVELSLLQCEQNQPVFQLLSADQGACSDMLAFAMMDAAGQS